MNQNKLQFLLLLLWLTGFIGCLLIVGAGFVYKSADYTFTDITYSNLASDNNYFKNKRHVLESIMDSIHRVKLDKKAFITAINTATGECPATCHEQILKESQNGGYKEFFDASIKIYVPWLTIMLTAFLSFRHRADTTSIDKDKIIIILFITAVYQFCMLFYFGFTLFDGEPQETVIPEAQMVAITSVVVIVINFVFPTVLDSAHAVANNEAKEGSY